ncbi:MAG: hypothetical protein LAO24_12245 [Acidobacteriia bacterium]|nr:hypothetical protein [Terriglobia bacterium]
MPAENVFTWQNAVVAILGPVAGYAGTLAKSWIEQSNVRARQTSLCEEADRLIKFHATLAEAAVPSPKVQSAQVAVVSQLDRVLEKLSQSLTEPLGSAGHVRSTAIVRLENWLLLYRPLGFWSAVLHSLFFMMIPVWFLFFYFGFVNDLRTHAPDTGISVLVLVIFLIPVVLCNYVARKVDAWSRRRREAAQQALPR